MEISFQMRREEFIKAESAIRGLALNNWRVFLILLFMLPLLLFTIALIQGENIFIHLHIHQYQVPVFIIVPLLSGIFLWFNRAAWGLIILSIFRTALLMFVVYLYLRLFLTMVYDRNSYLLNESIFAIYMEEFEGDKRK